MIKNVVKCVLNKFYEKIICILKFCISPTIVIKIFKIIDLFGYFIVFKNCIETVTESFGIC